MRVLHISTCDWMGGAGKAANRLHNELKKHGVDSHMLVDVKECLDDNSIHSITGLTGWWSRLFYYIRGKVDHLPLLLYPNRIKKPWAIGRLNRNIEKYVDKLQPDIVHMHWNSANVSIKELSSLSYPTVWTMHDNNLATGGCCCPGECKKYQSCCGKCPQLGSAKEYDLSRRVNLMRQNCFLNSDIKFVVLSEWQRKIALSSSIHRNSMLTKIPNGVDIETFFPMNMKECRKELNLPLDRRLLLFGAEAIDDPVKGGNVLAESLSILGNKFDNKEKPVLVIFGRTPDVDKLDFGLKVINMGYLNKEKLVKLYSSVDVTIVPSLEDNCPQVPLEAQACGCPVVGFAGTGVAELVEDGNTGFIVDYGDEYELCNGIVNALKADLDIRQSCRNYVEKEYDIALVVRKYINLYKSVL